MPSKALTSADLSELTGYTRHQLRALLAELPAYQTRAERPRVAREYTKHDLAVIAVCCELDTRYGLRRDAIAAVSPFLAQALLGPRTAGKDIHLIVSCVPPCVQYVEDVPVGVREGLVLPLRQLFARLDNYFTAEYVPGSQHQRSLDLGPMPVSPTRGTAARSPQAQEARSVTTSVVGGRRRRHSP
jgi:hypothetical protein